MSESTAMIDELHGVRTGDVFDSGMSRYTVTGIKRNGYVLATRSDGREVELWIDTFFNRRWRKLAEYNEGR